MNVAIIPARGGSKRIPYKNIREFCGRPIIAYSIDAARESGLFDRVIVSTDDGAIAAVARRCGAEVPFVRPEEAADDVAPIQAVMQHALDWLVGRGGQVDRLCCIYATAPMISKDDLRRGLELVQAGDATSSLAVTTYPYPVQRALSIDDHEYVRMLQPEHALTRSQDLPEVVHDAGQFVWWTAQTFARGDNRRKGVMVPRFRVQDIDTEDDWYRAELMYRAWHSGGEHD